ncbi:MAG TPA: hypothetical protein VI548_08130 [Chitinophagaceae bacterium]|nr:hypothetical protein [Chitinophagaceae bacterium]
MLLHKSALVIIFSLFIFSISYAQVAPDTLNEKILPALKKNFLKINLTGIALKNYSLQMERAVSRKVSFAVTLRTMPSGSIPFQKLVLKKIDDNDVETRDAIESFRLSNFAFTPEMKLYLSKRGYGQGFYMSFFYRYAKFTSNKLLFEVEDSPGVTRDLDFSGTISANTGGILFGVQWPIGKSLCLDLMILGPHFGSGKGLLSATTSPPLTSNEQNDLRMDLEELDIPFTRKTVTVNANGGSLKLDGPWGGLRSGISLGFRF